MYISRNAEKKILGLIEILIEVKFTTAPKITKSLHIAKEDLATKRNFIVCPVESGFPLDEDVQVIGYRELNKIFGLA